MPNIRFVNYYDSLFNDTDYILRLSASEYELKLVASVPNEKSPRTFSEAAKLILHEQIGRLSAHLGGRFPNLVVDWLVARQPIAVEFGLPHAHRNVLCITEERVMRSDPGNLMETILHEWVHVLQYTFHNTFRKFYETVLPAQWRRVAFTTNMCPRLDFLKSVVLTNPDSDSFWAVRGFMLCFICRKIDEKHSLMGVAVELEPDDTIQPQSRVIPLSAFFGRTDAQFWTDPNELVAYLVSEYLMPRRKYT